MSVAEGSIRIILKEISSLEADIDNIDGDILDLEVEKEGIRRKIKELRDSIKEE